MSKMLQIARNCLSCELRVASCEIRKAIIGARASRPLLFIFGLLLFIQSTLFAQSNVVTFEPTDSNPVITLYNLSDDSTQSVNLKNYLSTCETNKVYFDARTICPNKDTISTMEYSCEKGTAILFNETYLSTYTGGSYNGWYDWTISKQNLGWNSSWTTEEIQNIANNGYGTYEFAAAAGLGVNADAYSICYLDIYNNPDDFATIDFAEPSDLDSVFITNSTLSLANCVGGSSFSTPFSKEDDHFTLTIKGFTLDENDNHVYDSSKIADVDLVRFQDGTLTFLDSWKEVDLTTFTGVDGLDFFLETTDVGTWGANTPFYFALDSLTFASGIPPVPPVPPTPGSGVPEPSTWALLILGFVGLKWLKRQHGMRNSASLHYRLLNYIFLFSPIAILFEIWYSIVNAVR